MKNPKITRVNQELGGKVVLDFDFKKDALEFEKALRLMFE